MPLGMTFFILIHCFVFALGKPQGFLGNWDNNNNECHYWGEWSACNENCLTCRWCYDPNFKGPGSGRGTFGNDRRVMGLWGNQFMGSWESRKFRNEMVGTAYLGKENIPSDYMMGKNGTDDDYNFKNEKLDINDYNYDYNFMNEKLEINEEGKDHKAIEESLDAANKNNGTDGGKKNDTSASLLTETHRVSTSKRGQIPKGEQHDLTQYGLCKKCRSLSCRSTGRPIHGHFNDPIHNPIHDPVHDPIHNPIHDPIHNPIHDPIHNPIHNPIHDPIWPPPSPFPGAGHGHVTQVQGLGHDPIRRGPSLHPNRFGGGPLPPSPGSGSPFRGHRFPGDYQDTRDSDSFFLDPRETASIGKPAEESEDLNLNLK